MERSPWSRVLQCDNHHCTLTQRHIEIGTGLPSASSPFPKEQANGAISFTSTQVESAHCPLRTPTNKPQIDLRSVWIASGKPQSKESTTSQKRNCNLVLHFCSHSRNITLSLLMTPSRNLKRFEKRARSGVCGCRAKVAPVMADLARVYYRARRLTVFFAHTRAIGSFSNSEGRRGRQASDTCLSV